MLGGGGGGRGSETNFELLILSLNLLKTKFPYVHFERGGIQDQLPTFDPESKSALKTKFSYVCLGWGGGREEGRGGIPNCARQEFSTR